MGEQQCMAALDHAHTSLDIAALMLSVMAGVVVYMLVMRLAAAARSGHTARRDQARRRLWNIIARQERASSRIRPIRRTGT